MMSIKSFIFGLLVLCCFTRHLHADALTDGTLGARVPLNTPHFEIPEALGQRVGNNLFHSFERFNVPTDGSATFTGSLGIQNVLARVTGPTSSSIDGTLRSTISGANLYLMNPNGILFGPNARLDVLGSFHATTADSIRLGEDGQFNAREPSKSLLTVAPSEAFGFLSGPPAAIEVQGSFLQVPEGKELSAIGGDLTIRQGNLYAPHGRINLVSVASPGEAEISRDALLSFGKLGTITITQTSFEEARRLDSQQVLGNVDTSGIGGGKIFIRGGQFISNGGFIFADTYGDLPGQGVDVDIKESMDLSNAARITSDTVGSGQSGNIHLTTGKLSLSGSQNSSIGIVNAGIATNTFTTGKAGSISINASTIELYDRGRIESTTAENSTGDAGKVQVEADHISIKNEGYITGYTQGTGQGGEVDVNAHQDIVIEGLCGISTSTTFGKAGDLSIRAQRLLLKNGGFIDTSNFGNGQAGNLSINASEAIIMVGSQNEDNQPCIISSGAFGEQSGGTINITTPYLDANEGVIQSWAFSKALGAGGQVNLQVGRLVLKNNGRIYALSSGQEKAGNLHIFADDVWLEDSKINTSSLQAGGGEINLSVANHTNFFNSTITAQTQGDNEGDNGGNLTISRPYLFTMDSHSLLSAKANAGHGGNIDIKANNFFNPIPENITASSEKVINAFQPNLAGLLTTTLRNYLRRGLLKRPWWCGRHNRNQKQSSFAIQLEPRTWSPSDLRFSSPVLWEE